MKLLFTKLLLLANVRLAADPDTKCSNQDCVLGRVEVYVDGKWGGICAQLFDKNDANVLCHQLGYKKVAGMHFENTKPGAHYVLTELECTGKEEQITHCKSKRISAKDCSSGNNKNVFLQCEGKTWPKP